MNRNWLVSAGESSNPSNHQEMNDLAMTQEKQTGTDAKTGKTGLTFSPPGKSPSSRCLRSQVPVKQSMISKSWGSWVLDEYWKAESGGKVGFFSPGTCLRTLVRLHLQLVYIWAAQAIIKAWTCTSNTQRAVGLLHRSLQILFEYCFWLPWLVRLTDLVFSLLILQGQVFTELVVMENTRFI